MREGEGRGRESESMCVYIHKKRINQIEKRIVVKVYSSTGTPG